jgi:hypothetical protein
MAKVLLKNSFTAASVPAGLSAGELAVNVTDRKLFVGNAVGGVVTLVDPNALVTSFNGATGAVTGVSSVNGITGAVSITYAAAATVTSINNSSTFYPVFAGGEGNTALYVDNVTTPFSYVPSTGALNIRNLYVANGNTGIFLTTSAVLVANNSENLYLTSDSLDHEALSNSFTVSSTNSVKLTGSTIQFYGYGWGYTFPASNGSANQVLTTDGATPATLSWATPSSGITTGVANTFTALQTFSAGITSTTLYASAGVTFNSTSAHTGLATFSGGLTASNIFASSGVTFNSTSAHTGLATFSGGLTASGATFSGNVNLQDNVLSRVELLDYFERYVDLGDFASKGSPIPIDLSTGQVFRTKYTLAGTGLSVTNVPDNGNANAVGFSLLFVGDGTARTMTWNIGNTAASWAGGVAPTYTSTLNKIDVYSFLSRDGGSTWLGFVGGQNF